MKVMICIGSSCHLKGSRQIIETLQQLLNERNLNNKVELCGAFCMKNCVSGVNVKIDEELFSLTPDTTNSFFETEILNRLK